ncbi:MAG: 5'/3'-nucleotidase SurE [Chloroflexota bacterium]
MHILVTNDDGVRAPGLLALAEAAEAFGKVTILAPNRNWSAGGHVKTLTRPLRVEDVELANGRSAITCDGAPSDCVALADLGIVAEPIDLVVSGINAGPNLGHDVTYSGTVTAAMEAVIAGIPGIAFSYGGYTSSYDLEAGKAIVQQVLEKVLAHPLDKRMLLSVNIPLLSIEE